LQRHEDLNKNQTLSLQRENQKLAEEAQQLRTILNLAGQAIIVINAQQEIIIFNQMAEKLFGYDADDIIGSTIDRLLPENHIQLSHKIIDNFLPTDHSHRLVRGQAQRKDGSTFPAEIAVSLYQIGDAVFVTAVIHDLSLHLKNQTDSIRLAIERERVQMLQQFIEDASHEFRTPLAVIRSKVYLVQRMLNDKALSQHLNIIDMETQKIVNLLESLLHLQRMETPNLLQKESRPFHDLLYVVVSKHDESLRQKMIHLEFDLNAENDQMNMDDLEIALALDKIMDNAVQYSKENGIIHIRTLQHGSDLVLEIRDEGSGINPDNLPYIFERFYRADKAHTTAGFGLGLSIAKAIIEKHDGNIQVLSKENAGTTVQIILPLIVNSEDNPFD